MLKPGAVLLVDEAFMDFVEEGEGRTAVPLVSEEALGDALPDQVLLPGRAAAGIPDSTGRTRWRRWRTSTPLWRVNRLAEVAALAALADEEYIREMPARTAGEGALSPGAGGHRVYSRPIRLSANFLLAEITGAGMTSRRRNSKRRLLERGFLVRDASDFPGLDERFIRLAVLDRERNDALVRELEEVTQVVNVYGRTLGGRALPHRLHPSGHARR